MNGDAASFRIPEKGAITGAPLAGFDATERTGFTYRESSVSQQLRSAVSHEWQLFLNEVLRGLAQPEKELPCKYFYDATGSTLFEAICELPEYYLTRTELAIMQEHVAEMAARLGPECVLIEYGSGSGIKTELLLGSMTDPVAYVPIDLAREALLASADRLRSRFPRLEVLPLCADFSAPFTSPEPRRKPSRHVVYFPGSTIGNFGPPEAGALLSRAAALCGRGGAMLLGFDLQKPVSILEPAYDDRAGVTRDFNLNLLARINRELGADFDLAAFRHRAHFNQELKCIEMHLVSLKAQTVNIAGHAVSLRRDEAIRTERSYKYDVDAFRSWVACTGLGVQQVWTDPRHFFAVLYLTSVDDAASVVDGRR